MKQIGMREVTLELGTRETCEGRGSEGEGLEKNTREGYAGGEEGAAGDDADGTETTNSSGEHSKYFRCEKMIFFPE